MLYYVVVLSLAGMFVSALIAYVHVANRRIQMVSELVQSLSLCITSYIELQQSRVQLEPEINI